MPVQYPTGIMAEHNWTRQHAGLFDVSHMGQIRLTGPRAAIALETLVPGEIVKLAPGRQRYTLFTNTDCGILDDLMVTNIADQQMAGRSSPDQLLLVVNAACKHEDLSHLQARIGNDVGIEPMFERALLALQGPEAAAAVAPLAPALAELGFMTGMAVTIAGIDAFVTRSGYTGEDGFEISVAAGDAQVLAERLLADPRVKPIGLGARDSLRLEAGLCLYGQDMDPTTTILEAALEWTVSRRRRIDGGFPGADVMLAELTGERQVRRRRVGLKPEGRQPARHHDPIAVNGGIVGVVTSGGFGPSFNGPVAMGYVPLAMGAPGTRVELIVRGKPLPASIAQLPFLPHRYYRPQARPQ
jgi:aminomethyltransferase